MWLIGGKPGKSDTVTLKPCVLLPAYKLLHPFAYFEHLETITDNTFLTQKRIFYRISVSSQTTLPQT